jgi:DNA-binding Lrp family transcriptional regulator
MRYLLVVFLNLYTLNNYYHLKIIHIHNNKYRINKIDKIEKIDKIDKNSIMFVIKRYYKIIKI